MTEQSVRLAAAALKAVLGGHTALFLESQRTDVASHINGKLIAAANKKKIPLLLCLNVTKYRCKRFIWCGRRSIFKQIKKSHCE